MTISLMEKADFIEKYNGKDDEVLTRMYDTFHKIQHAKASLLLNLKPPEAGDDEAYWLELMRCYEHYRALEFADAAIREILTGEDMYEQLMQEPLTLERFLALLKGFKHEMANYMH